MLDAVRRGCKKLIVGLGGSCTNDMGVGAAAACGADFGDVLTGGTLDKMTDVDLSQLRKQFAGVEIVAMCDIENPLCGERGAAYVFAPQKGADAEMVRMLDANLRHAANVVERALGREIADKPGAGAAGGMGAGMDAFFGARLCSGIDVVLDTVDFDGKLPGADYVFTGEGRVDAQSLGGKVVVGVGRRAKNKVPVIAFVGAIEDPIDAIYDEGVNAVFTILRRTDANFGTENDLSLTVDNFMRMHVR